jgi:hypothetical protein
MLFDGTQFYVFPHKVRKPWYRRLGALIDLLSQEAPVLRATAPVGRRSASSSCWRQPGA